MYNYYIFDPKEDIILPDNSKYYSKIKYENCDYIRFFQDRSDVWKKVDKKRKQFFFSNYEDKSYIKTFSTDIIKRISNKTCLTKLINEEEYYPNTVIFELQSGNYIPKDLMKIWNPEVGSLWFLKKASDLTYGGFDVFPLIYKSKANSLKHIQSFINEANSVKKYRSDKFILQKGVNNPLLVEVSGNKYKFDIRAYGLFIKVSPESPINFYFFKKFLIRRSISQYDPSKTSKEIMLTNTTQAKEFGLSYGETSSIGSLETHEVIYEKMFGVYTNLVDHYLSDSNLKGNDPCISIIGIDFIFNEDKEPFILEINKYPAIHCNKEKRALSHYNMEDSMFDNDFYDISFDAIINKTPYLYSTENWLHVNDKTKYSYFLYDKKQYPVVRYEHCDYKKYFEEKIETWEQGEETDQSFFFSNHQDRSKIKIYKYPMAYQVSNKAYLSEMIKSEEYSPKSLVFTLDNTYKLPKNLMKKWNPDIGSLWFLKKSALVSYGGTDVFPIIFSGNIGKILTEIQKYINLSNKGVVTKSNVFVLQKGVHNPLLQKGSDNKMYKFDIRAFGLIVKIGPEYPPSFYFCKYYITRRSISPYDSNSVNKNIMITNITHARKQGHMEESLVSLQSYYTHKDLVDKMFDVYSKLSNDYLENMDYESNPIISVMGFDFIFDKNENPYLIEINRTPSMFCRPENRTKFYHGIQDLMYKEDFYDISFDAIINKTPYLYSTENWLHVSS